MRALGSAGALGSVRRTGAVRAAGRVRRVGTATPYGRPDRPRDLGLWLSVQDSALIADELPDWCAYPRRSGPDADRS
ncbi:hypothetical protein GCM10010435_49680 [Winogradskya consettensis]|uniref:Uncharacterized protein n=1 Tax=Winogradskya consettensis TaxID=113560 RepID=A0A919SWN3_9ACTN|nr:hypothetical protein Aco04nite_68600 [Actinoplanes consettensis]